jgi:hypothetical protein
MAPLEAGWQISLTHVLWYFVALSIIHVLRAIRWEPLIRPLLPVRLSVSRLNAISAVGFMAIFLLPLRLGEFVRPYLVKKEVPSTSMTSLLGSVALERIADGLMVTLFLFLALASTSNDYSGGSDKIIVGAWISLIVFSSGMVVLLSLLFFRKQALQILEYCLKPFPSPFRSKVTYIVHQFSGGLSSIPNGKAMLSFTWMTALYWGINGVAIWAVAPGFGLDIQLSVGFMMMSCVVVGMMIPNSPGNLGTFWYFVLLPLTAIGSLENSIQVTLFGLVLYLAQLSQQTAFGLWFIFRGTFTSTALMEATQYGDEDSASTESTHPTP